MDLDCESGSFGSDKGIIHLTTTEDKREETVIYEKPKYFVFTIHTLDFLLILCHCLRDKLYNQAAPHLRHGATSVQVPYE